MQRAVPKTHDRAMGNLDQKLEAKQEAVKKAEKELEHAKTVLNISFIASLTLLIYIRELKVAAIRKNTRKKRGHFKSGFFYQFLYYL